MAPFPLGALASTARDRPPAAEKFALWYMLFASFRQDGRREARMTKHESNAEARMKNLFRSCFWLRASFVIRASDFLA